MGRLPSATTTIPRNRRLITSPSLDDRMHLVAVDVGGTHTDLYARSPSDTTTTKVPSTPANPAVGVVDAVERADIDLGEVDHLLHGSTIATNAIIEGTHPTAAFVTTEGFRDVLEIGRYHREELYDPYQTKPDPLVPRRRRYTVPERVDETGATVEPLDETAVRAVAADLDGVEAVAVGFVNSYVNDEHERRAAEVLRAETDCYVVTSASVAPKLGTLERFSTTVVNAALAPLMGGYLGDLASMLEDRGFGGQLSVVKSSGGVMSAETAREAAETTVLSGPAAGAKGAGFVGAELGADRVLGMDMGGTSTDVSLVEDGEPLTTTEYEVAFDVPLAVPMVDVNAIGSGGGTIAWVDDGGSLRVGPRSAGADPGPACYPEGGDAPTVTDANLTLGRLNPDYFLGGEVPLDERAAREAVADLGDRVGLGPLETAAGIVEIATEHMAAAIRETTIDRGRDPRDYALVGFGGCGPMHAVTVAKTLGVPRVVVPANPGVLSAVAGTMMDVQYGEETSFFVAADEVETDDLNDALADLAATVRASVRDDVEGDVSVSHVAEMRYVGQTYELDVPLPEAPLDDSDVAAAVERFHETHETEYGLANRAFDVEFVGLRTRASASYTDASLETVDVDAGDPRRGGRDVFFGGEWHETVVYDRTKLDPGTELETPAIVEDTTATAVVDPGTDARVDGYGNVVVETGGDR
jgi:N-methylhydantoinase A